MLGYNGSIPGPTLHVDQGSEVTIEATNLGDVDATLHWHGLQAREPLRRRPRGDAGADRPRRDLHLPAAVPRPRLLLVSPAHPRGLRPGDGPLRGHHRRAVRPGLLAAGRPRAGDHARRHPDRGRPDRAVRALRSDLHGDGPLRQRDADQRRDRLPRRGQGRRGRPSAPRRHGQHADLQLRRHRRADEAGRRRQRSGRARGVHRRGAALPVGARDRRRPLRPAGRGHPREPDARTTPTSSATSPSTARRPARPRPRSRSCGSIPSSPPSASASRPTSSASPTRRSPSSRRCRSSTAPRPSRPRATSARCTPR